MQTTLLHWLHSAGHDYHIAEHPAVHTIDEAQLCAPALPGLMCKNIFVRDAKGKRHVLVIVPCDKRIDLLALGLLLQTSRLGFASPDRLLRHLGVTPGSVSVLALMQDTGHAVELVLDQAVWMRRKCRLIPCVIRPRWRYRMPLWWLFLRIRAMCRVWSRCPHYPDWTLVNAPPPGCCRCGGPA